MPDLRGVVLGFLAACSSSGPPQAPDPLPLPVVVDLGGPTMAHPQLVMISYSDDTDSDSYASFAAWIVQSFWLGQVGTEYGVGSGSVLGNVQLGTPAPDDIGDGDIIDLLFNGIADGTLPSPPAGDFLNTIYIVNFPTHTTIHGGGQTSCVDYLGFHDSARRNGREIAYAVIPSCPNGIAGLSTLEVHQFATSHEIIEAATDPVPGNNPAFQVGDPSNSWIAIGGVEVADLCLRGDTSRAWGESGFVATRSWSKMQALTGEPCVPLPGPETYFNVMATPVGIQRAAAGGSFQFQLSAYATAAVRSWSLGTATTSTDKPTLKLGATSLGPGFQTTLGVTAPTDAAAESELAVFVVSTGSADYQLLPLRIAVGPPCSSAHDCVSCTQQDGCGWCSTTSHCEALGPSGSAESSCTGDAFASTSGACPGFCASHNGSCSDCTSQFGCGWCASASGTHCLEFGGNGSMPKNATCDYADWSFTPDYCP